MTRWFKGFLRPSRAVNYRQSEGCSLARSFLPMVEAYRSGRDDEWRQIGSHRSATSVNAPKAAREYEGGKTPFSKKAPLCYGAHTGTSMSDRAKKPVAVAKEKQLVIPTVAAVEEEKPPRFAPRVKAAPRIRQLYWCDFPKDGHLPEFWKTRPVLILSFKNTLYGAVTIIPCSGQDQTGNKWAIPLTTTVDGLGPSWAICDKPTTVAVSRLSPDRSGIRHMPEAEFNPILSLVLEWLPRIPGA